MTVRLPGRARAWLGIGAAVVVIVCGLWMAFEYVRAVSVESADKARIEALKERAKTDGTIHRTLLQPEFDRQREALTRRHRIYRGVGPVALVALAIFLVWVRWLRPAPGDWAGAPRWLPRLFGGTLDHPLAAGTGGPRPGAARSGRTMEAAPVFALPPARERPALDLGAVDEILESAGRQAESVIPVLQAIQTKFRYLPDEALRKVADASRMTPAQIAGVASFYGQFRQRPVGEHIIRVCEGTACHVSGAGEVRAELCRCLGIKGHEDTDPSGQFTVERVACVGSCSLAPVVTMDEKIYGRLSALTAAGVLRDFIAEQGARSNGNGHKPGAKGAGAVLESVSAAFRPVEIRIGVGSCGIASGALEVQAALEEEVRALGGGATIKPVGCAGFCHREPLVEVVDGGATVLYGNVTPGDVRKLVRQHVGARGLASAVRAVVGDVHARLADDGAWSPISAQAVAASPYITKQVRIVLENCGAVDPRSLDDYRGRDGFRALEACLARTPEQVIEEIRASGLRGRGGAGFPTGVKWGLARQAAGETKFVIGNGDEGDPGAFMDRAVLEADPFRVIEGITIAAYAIGAQEGILYIRQEYPIAVRNVRAAIESAASSGLLGERILGSAFGFTLQVREGAGAFVCGEETALIQSLEGQRGMPRPRPPYPAQAGYRGQPTLINNVETLACVPWIVRKGAAAFAALGTERSKGTKVFSLAGKIVRGGLIEVPMGITIRDIVQEVGGGIKGGRAFKAVLAGGPSGGCIPASLADTRVDYEELSSTGAIMGSGGLVVLDDRDCAVDIARYFLHFTQDESCGKCTFCRVGTRRMLEILDRICAGRGRDGDLEMLEGLAHGVKTGSLCGLGQTAPNPVITTLKYFRDEYEVHIRDRRCPAGSCKALIHYRVIPADCTGCTLCAQACPVDAIERRPYRPHEVIDDLCTRCGMCLAACPERAIEVV
jgi:NADH-quinone oxidoreductase subunit F